MFCGLARSCPHRSAGCMAGPAKTRNHPYGQWQQRKTDRRQQLSLLHCFGAAVTYRRRRSMVFNRNQYTNTPSCPITALARSSKSGSYQKEVLFFVMSFKVGEEASQKHRRQKPEAWHHEGDFWAIHIGGLGPFVGFL